MEEDRVKKIKILKKKLNFCFIFLKREDYLICVRGSLTIGGKKLYFDKTRNIRNLRGITRNKNIIVSFSQITAIFVQEERRKGRTIFNRRKITVRFCRRLHGQNEYRDGKMGYNTPTEG